MSALDEIGRRVAQLQERLVSAVVFAAAAAAAALVVPPERRFMVCVCLGAAGWAMIECFRLHVAGDDERETLDQLILVGSCDPRCERRRAQLRSRGRSAHPGTDAAADVRARAYRRGGD